MKIKLTLFMNKRADIPTVILVLGVFVVCSLTLLSFYFASDKDSDFFKGVLLIKAVSEIADDVKVYNKLGKTPEEAMNLIGFSEGKIIEKDNFKLTGKFDGKEYTIIGTFNESKWLGFVEGDQLVEVKYEFSK